MESRVVWWVGVLKKMLGHPDGPNDNVAILVLGALTADEGNALDKNGEIPSDDRINEIASQAGCSAETAAGIMRVYHWKFTEGIRILPQ